ncbi:hypothetical protein ATANTOWER_002684 [Ataeniobius toweri]|uniref:Uncharacterized protein n=1 Tax=Ataeniobius toweri TaxID=208326 RepID=A0ABU7ATW9_9TELE|nr:hypothetical protein [Ataeniobius toweri]
MVSHILAKTKEDGLMIQESRTFYINTAKTKRCQRVADPFLLIRGGFAKRKVLLPPALLKQKASFASSLASCEALRGLNLCSLLTDHMLLFLPRIQLKISSG